MALHLNTSTVSINSASRSSRQLCVGLRNATALAMALLLLAGCGRGKHTEIGPATLEKNTVWEGSVTVNGDVYVPPGVTLTVQPGTVVRFKRIDETSTANLFGTDTPYYPQAELIVRGKIVAIGTKNKFIVFTSAEVDARPGDWGAVNLLGSDGNIFEHAKFLFAYNGIHGHGSIASVNQCEFSRNGVGISFKKEEETPDVEWYGRASSFIISRSHFFLNKGGIGFRNSKAEISDNIIEDNKFFGIFPKEQADALITRNDIRDNKKGVYLYQTEKLRLEYNNIHANTDYNIGVAEAQDFDVPAANNWFGSTDRKVIDDLIFDKKDDEYLGAVLYEPILDKPVEITK